MNLAAIRSYCKERGISVSDLEKNTGLSNGTIGKWANSYPRIDYLQVVADYFGVTVYDLSPDGFPLNKRERRSANETEGIE